MTITPKTILLALAASIMLMFGFSLLSSPTSPTAPTSQPLASKESEAGNVTISVTPITLKSGFPASFDVTVETHSVELDFDMEAVAGLTDAQGATYKPAWQGSPPGGHHRSGTLTFTPDIPKRTTVTLTFRTIAGVPARTFAWEVNQ